jgi:tetratricopeptide (TPR) repeat protein
MTDLPTAYNPFQTRPKWARALDLPALLRHPYFALAIIVLLGVGLRLWLISVNLLDPRFSNADDGDYYRRALRVAVGGPYLDDAWLIRPPGHIYFFAFWLWLALAVGLPQWGVLFVQLAQVGLSVGTIVLGYAVATRLFDRPERPALAGLLFASFLSIWFSFVEMPTVLFSELLYLFLFLLHVWLLIRFDAQQRWRDLAFSGVVLGFAALTRSPALYSLAFVALWLLVRWWERRKLKPPTRFVPDLLRTNVPQILVISLCCLAIVAPWTARNYVLYQRFIPVDTLGQINLWLDLDRVAMRDPNIQRLREMPQRDRHVYALAQARAILQADPWRPLRDMGPTFRHIWKAQFVEDYFVKQSFFTRPLREAALLGLFGDLLWGVFTLAGIVGLAGPVREGWRYRLFFLAWLGYSFLTVLVFHVEPRYLIPIWTLFGLYGAGALAHFWQNKRFTWRWPIAPRLLALHGLRVGLVLLFFWLVLTYRDYPALISRGFAREQAAVAGDRAYLAGDYPTAVAHYQAALAAHPEFVDARVTLALSLAAQGQRDEAIALVSSDDRRGLSWRANLVWGALLRAEGEPEVARRQLERVEENGSENVQRWSLAWLRPEARNELQLGNGLDLGYISGFSPAEGPPEQHFRWLEGQGEIVIPLAAPLASGDTIQLRMTGSPQAETPLNVQIGDAPWQTVRVASGQWRMYRLRVPESQIGQSRLVLRLSAPTFIPAQMDQSSDDARTLSLMISELRVIK